VMYRLSFIQRDGKEERSECTYSIEIPSAGLYEWNEQLLRLVVLFIYLFIYIYLSNSCDV
jgi:hypothetical protein